METAPPDICHLDAGDLTVEPLERLVCAGDGCKEFATHTVWIDFRNAGQKQQVGPPLCQVCANDLSFRIRQGLPMPPAPKSETEDPTPF